MAGKTIGGVLAMLVASGNGERCNLFRAQLRTILFTKDEKTGLSKLHIHKFRKTDLPEDYYRICSEVGSLLPEITKGIPEKSAEKINLPVFN